MKMGGWWSSNRQYQAILIHPEYGAEYWGNRKESPLHKHLFRGTVYHGDLNPEEYDIVWIRKNTTYKIRDYDGKEYAEVLDLSEWDTI